MTESVLYTIFLVFTGSAILATVLLYLKQSILLAYIAAGILAGPDVLGLVTDVTITNDISRVGIIFLLFLLGSSLEPDELFPLIKKASIVTIVSSLVFLITGLLMVMLMGFTLLDSLIIGLALTSSSTLLALKLLPTSELHHKHMAEMIVSILLLQDIMAILMILFIGGLSGLTDPVVGIPLLILQVAISVPILVYVAYYISKNLLSRLIAKFDTLPEYITILSIGWCVGVSQLFGSLNMSYEIGGFIAGVTLAANPVARHIVETLKPVRDFFLVLFFFGIGATLDVPTFIQYLPQAFSLTIVMIGIKYYTFKKLLSDENRGPEIALRIGQISEFSLLIGVVAVSAGLLSQLGSTLLQGATVISFIVSSTLIVYTYPSPISPENYLRKD